MQVPPPFVPPPFVPPPPFAPSPQKPPKPARGALLSILLVLITLGGVSTLGGAFLLMAALRAGAYASPGLSASSSHGSLTGLLLLAVAVGIFQLVSAAGMWNWKRWGVYGFVALSLLQFFMSSRINPDHHVSFTGLVWIVLVLAAALPKWGAFDD